MEDNSFIDELFSKHYEHIYDYCLAKLSGDEQAAADAAGDVFLSARKKADKLRDHPDPRGWLFLTARNRIRDVRKKRKRYRKRYILFDPLFVNTSRAESGTSLSWWEKRVVAALCAPDDYREESGFSESELIALKSAFLDGLSEEERKLFKERYENGLSLTELGKMYGVSEGAIRMRLSRITARLTERIKIYFQNDRAD